MTFNVAILGATGLVGQRLQQLLENHPLFSVKAIAGSAKNIGKHHSEIEWRLDTERPIYNLMITAIHEIGDVDIAFSALPSNIAKQVELDLVGKGINVFSNSSAHRLTSGVPLVIPEINPEDFEIFNGHACATNCTVVPVAMGLSGLKQFGIEEVEISTQQALSGAGWRLLFDEKALSGEVDSFIEGEEEKLCSELKHLLGIDIPVKATCNRVAQKDGHLVFVKAKFRDKITLKQIKKEMPIANLNLPSSPTKLIKIIDECPSREKDLWAGGGMTTTIGEISISENVVSFSALSHNTVRGAAGGLILLAEFAAQKAYITK